MARRGTHAPEVVRRVAQSPAEVPLPHAVGDASPGERVRRGDEPVGERGPAGRLRDPGRKVEPGGQSGDAGQCPGADRLLRSVDVATREHPDLAGGVDRDRPALVGRAAGGGVELPRRGEGPETGPGMGPEDRRREGLPLGGGACRWRHRQSRLGIGRQRHRAVGVAVGDRHPEVADRVGAAVELSQLDDESLARTEGHRLGEDEDGVVRPPLLRMDAPRGRRVAVDGVLDRPAVLVEVGARAGDRGQARRAALREDAGLELRQVEVAVGRPSGAAHRERIVGEEVESDGGDRWLRSTDGEGEHLLLRCRAGDEDRAVGPAHELRGEGRGEARQGQRPPGPPPLPFPRGDERRLRLVEERRRRRGGEVGEARPTLPLGGHGGVGLPVDLPLADPGEDGLEGVVVLLGDRVELVRVAAGAVGGGARERLHRLRHHVVTVQILEAARRGDGGGVVVGAGPEEAEGGLPGRVIGEAVVGGEL